MVGRDVGELYYKEDIKKGKELLRVENLERDSELSDVSFSLHEGEVLGVYGLLGAGRTELVRSLFGAEPITGGKIIIEGEEVKIDNPSQAINNNIGLLPEDRHEEGVALLQSVNDNCNVVSSKFSARYGVLNKKVERETTRKNIEDLNIKTPSINQLVKNLSGGNQQKVVIAKWINANSNILLFDEPTVGIDVGAKKEIYVLMSELLKEGKGIIFVSSYIPELMEICDRIMVLSRGKMTGIVEKEDFDQEELLYLATRE
nr:ATP-binding cassette domain-containing protein [Halonatronomonas betaini]